MLMPEAAEGPLPYRLVVDSTGLEPVHVFLPDHPDGDGPPGTRVVLWSVTGPAGPLYLGRAVWDPQLYREFRSEIELLLAGYEPAGPYRVCDSWVEYLDPWCGNWTKQPTERVAWPSPRQAGDAVVPAGIPLTAGGRPG